MDAFPLSPRNGAADTLSVSPCASTGLWSSATNPGVHPAGTAPGFNSVSRLATYPVRARTRRVGRLARIRTIGMR
jgi:hypothetical protein